MYFKRGKINKNLSGFFHFFSKNRTGQLTIFIIIAVILAAAVAVFFIFRNSTGVVSVPASIQPVYASFLSCLEDDASIGVDVLESQGGYIQLPEFETGSRYMPFSSQLNFLGNPIPYWYYVSGNNIQKTQVPTKQEMGKQIQDFIDGKIRDCVLSQYYQQGFEIGMGLPKSQVTIGTNSLDVNLNMDLTINKGQDSAFISIHKINLKKNLGELYDSAIKVYNYEQDNLFLENYGVDVLRSYAPVDGVKFSCAPEIWNADNVFGDLKQAIEVNTLALRNNGDKNNYFNAKIPVSSDVHFVNSRDWANSFEVNPSQGNVLLSNPVGNQPGLGILGFCYVPYHFVYNVNYPVLVQVSNGDEIFQFPLAVVIQGNKPRQALNASAVGLQTAGICDYNNTMTEVKTYDSNMNPINADVSYECFGEVCNIGQTKNGILDENFPQCVNGFINVRANGFKENTYMYSTTNPGNVDIVLDRVYNTVINLKIDGKNYNGKATINFVSGNSSKTIIYPEQKIAELTEGQYEIQVYAYENSSITLGQGSYQQCVDILLGATGLLGIKTKKCFDVNVPSQIISTVLSGGGKQNYYITESELKSSNSIEINAQSFPLPKTIDELQKNYISFGEKGLEINFK